ncbi:hypothetical protein [Chryseobacterium wanjuense]
MLRFHRKTVVTLNPERIVAKLITNRILKTITTRKNKNLPATMIAVQAVWLVTLS